MLSVRTHALVGTLALLPFVAWPLCTVAQGSPGESTVVIGGPGDLSIDLAEVSEVEFMPDGRLLVLDRQSVRLHLFAQDGRLIHTHGREGDGPGEWRFPSSLDVVPPGSIHLISQGLGRVHAYQLRGGELQLVEEASIDFIGRDLCMLDEGMFLLGLRGGQTIHHVGPSGEVMRSFAPPVKRPNELLGAWAPVTAEWTADGRVLCDRQQGLLIHVPSHLPTVSAYKPSGELAWRFDLPNWSQVRWERRGDGRIQAAPAPDTGVASSVVSAVWLSKAGLLVQVRNFGTPGDPSSESEVMTVLIDVVEGSSCTVSQALPKLLAKVGDRWAWLGEALIPEVRIGPLGITECGP